MTRLLRLIALALVLHAPRGGARAADAQERIAVFPETGTPVIATEVLIAAGPANESAREAGLAYLAARAVTEPIRPLLDSLDAHLALNAQKDALSFTLTAAPDVWEEATRLLLVALFRDPVDARAVAQQQRAIQRELQSRVANPADAVLREVEAAVFGPEHPWGRPAVGSPESVVRLTHSQVDAFLRAHFTPDRAVAVVVGPVEEQRARAHLGSYLRGAGPVPGEVIPPRPRDQDVRRDYNSITTWVSASFPFASDSDEEALRVLAHLVQQELEFGPTRRSVFNVRSEVIPRVGGGELRITLVVPPREAGEWATRLRQVVRDVAEREALPGDWEARIRRYRGERLRSLAAPEDRAQEAARRLFIRGRSPELLPALDGLSRERVQRAVRSLGEPTVVYLGPFLDDEAR